MKNSPPDRFTPPDTRMTGVQAVQLLAAFGDRGEQAAARGAVDDWNNVEPVPAHVEASILNAYRMGLRT